MSKTTGLILVGVLWLFAVGASGQPENHHVDQPSGGAGVTPTAVLLLKQDRDGAAANNLSAAELATLGDPLFTLVLRDRADVTTLAPLENLIQPDASKRQTFVVDENIAQARKGSRRAVISFSGSNGGEVLTSNVMLSLAFDSEIFPKPPAIEAWGWDNHRGRYNYYKMDRTGTPDMRATWKFRGSSENADLLSPADRRGTCLECHTNGGPVMKELAFPWNNWHSFESNANYLLPSGQPTVRWKVAENPLLKDRLKGAEELETGGILPSLTQFNNRRINVTLARQDTTGDVALDAQGLAMVNEGRRLLRQLFVTTEYNIISSRQRSKLHPLPAATAAGPDQDVVIPNTFFLNANLVAGGTPARYKGLGVPTATQFAQFAKVKPAEYKALVNDSGVRLGGRPGDADFAWFVPEPSHSDIDMADRLMRRGIVTPQFVAAVVAVDLENPVLSPDRASLLRFMPESFLFRPLKPTDDPLTNNRHPDDLTKKVIAILEAATTPADSPEARLLAGLKSDDAIKRLREATEAYIQRTKTRLADPATRSGELRRLHDAAIARRQAVVAHETFAPLNETGNRLFPVP